jgi:hypothetical protein
MLTNVSDEHAASVFRIEFDYDLFDLKDKTGM